MKLRKRSFLTLHVPLYVQFCVLSCFLPILSAQFDDLGNQIQGVEISCDPSELRLKVYTTQPYYGRIYPKGLGKSACEKVYEGFHEDAEDDNEADDSALHDGSNSTSSAAGNQTYLSIFTLPLTSCNTVINDLRGGLEYQNTVVIQTHRSLITQHDRLYNLRCKYENMNTTIVATLNMSTRELGRSYSDLMPSRQLEATAALPAVLMTIYKGSSDSRVMADSVTIGDPIALVVNLAPQKVYGMMVRDCYVKDGVDMGGIQQLIDSRGCPVDPTLMGNLVYSDDLTQAYVIFRAHKFPYTDSLYYECSVRFCLKLNGDCKALPSPPQCDKERSLRYRRNAAGDSVSGNTTKAKTIAVVRGISVKEPTGVPDTDADYGVSDTALSGPSGSQWCLPRSAVAVVVAVTAFLIFIATTVLISVVLERRKRRFIHKDISSEVYSSSYMNPAFMSDRSRQTTK